MTDDQMMLMLRLTFEAGVHRGETMEKRRVGQLAMDYVAPDFPDFFQAINPFYPFRINEKDAGKGGYVVD